jgi:hypothetical protein
MLLKLTTAVLALLAGAARVALAKPTTSPPHNPQVEIKNGTLRGLYLPAFDEDLFLGVPFASPPIGDLRLRHPAPYDEHWQHVRDATRRSPSCPGYAGFDVGLVLGEDCLTVDIVRPAGTSHKDKLPVLVWIYGGGKWGFFQTFLNFHADRKVQVLMLVGVRTLGITHRTLLMLPSRSTSLSL